MAAIVVRPAHILLFEVTASRSGDLPSWSSSDMAFDRLDHPFLFTLDPVLDEHPTTYWGWSIVGARTSEGGGAC